MRRRSRGGHVRVDVQADRGASAFEHLLDAGGTQRALAFLAEPEVRQPRVRVPRALADVAAECLGRADPERHGPRPTALAVDLGDLLADVDVVDIEAGPFGAADAGIDEQSDDGVVTPVRSWFSVSTRIGLSVTAGGFISAIGEWSISSSATSHL